MQIRITLGIAIRCPMLENADNTVNKIEIHRQRLRDAYGKKKLFSLASSKHADRRAAK